MDGDSALLHIGRSVGSAAIILSPFFVSLIAVVPSAVMANNVPGRGALELVQRAVPSSSLLPCSALALGLIAVNVFLSSGVQVGLGHNAARIAGVSCALITLVVIWLAPQAAYSRAASLSAAYFGSFVLILLPPLWVYFVSVGCTLVLAGIAMPLWREHRAA